MPVPQLAFKLPKQRRTLPTWRADGQAGAAQNLANCSPLSIQVLHHAAPVEEPRNGVPRHAEQAGSPGGSQRGNPWVCWLLVMQRRCGQLPKAGGTHPTLAGAHGRRRRRHRPLASLLEHTAAVALFPAGMDSFLFTGVWDPSAPLTAPPPLQLGGPSGFYDPYWTPGAGAATRRRLSAPIGTGGAGGGREREVDAQQAAQALGRQRTREPHTLGAAGW